MTKKPKRYDYEFEMHRKAYAPTAVRRIMRKLVRDAVRMQQRSDIDGFPDCESADEHPDIIARWLVP